MHKEDMMREVVCPNCNSVLMIALDKQRFRIINSGRTFTFIPGSDIVYRCKISCGYLGVLKVDQIKWKTTLSNGRVLGKWNLKSGDRYKP